MGEKERLYVEIKTTHNSYIGTHFKGKVSEAINFYVNRETIEAKGKFVTSLTISNADNRVFSEI